MILLLFSIFTLELFIFQDSKSLILSIDQWHQYTIVIYYRLITFMLNFHNLHLLSFILLSRGMIVLYKYDHDFLSSNHLTLRLCNLTLSPSSMILRSWLYDMVIESSCNINSWGTRWFKAWYLWNEHSQIQQLSFLLYDVFLVLSFSKFIIEVPKACKHQNHKIFPYTLKYSLF